MKDFVQKYLLFKGRGCRREFWTFFIILVLAGIALEYTVGHVRTNLLLTPLIWPYLSLATRRLHDTNHSGWWILCPIYNIVLLAMKGECGNNKYGEPPVR